MCCREDVDEAVLGVVCILVFVDVDVFEAGLVAFADFGEELEEGYGLHYEVVEVHGVVLVESPLVEVVDLGDVLGDVAFRVAQKVVRGHKDVLRGANLGLKRPRVEALGVLAELHDAPLDEPDLIRAVVDGELSFVAELLGVDAQDAGAEGVEGGDPHPPGVGADEESYPVLHLTGGLVGEGYSQDLFGRGEPLVYKVGDTMREHARLPAPRAGKDEEGTFRVLYGVKLR